MDRTLFRALLLITLSLAWLSDPAGALPQDQSPQLAGDRPQPARAATRSQQQAAAPSAELAEVVQQLALLGDEQFQARERATDRLIELGAVALPQLEAAREHPDREIRYRVERILTIVRRNDFQRRLEAFAADNRSEADYGLPGWPIYRDLVGSTPASRALFVEMLRCEPDLFHALASSTQEAVVGLEARVLQLQFEMYQDRLQGLDTQPIGHHAALLFIVDQPTAQIPDHILRFVFDGCRQAKFERSITESSFQAPLKKLLGRAVERATDFAAGPAITLALRHDLDEGLAPAIRLLSGGQNVLLPSDRPIAVLAVGRFGDLSHVAHLENLLTDSTPYMQNQSIDHQVMETQLRDLALAALWKMHGEDPRKHGFHDQVREDPHLLFVPQTLGFANEQQRHTALENWRKFRRERAERQSPSLPASQPEPR